MFSLVCVILYAEERGKSKVGSSLVQGLGGGGGQVQGLVAKV